MYNNQNNNRGPATIIVRSLPVSHTAVVNAATAVQVSGLYPELLEGRRERSPLLFCVWRVWAHTLYHRWRTQVNCCDNEAVDLFSSIILLSYIV